MSDEDIVSRTWCGLDWTSWLPFDADRKDFRQFERVAGVYRVRVRGTDKFAYIGQTGRSLRERLQVLTAKTLQKAMPYNDPHTAAPALWSYKEAEGLEYDCSGAVTPLPVNERKALECRLIWRNRLAACDSTLANFGRCHPRFVKPTNYRGGKGRPGRWLPEGEINPSCGPATMTLRLRGEPGDSDWMGLVWSSKQPLETDRFRTVPDQPGVYAIFDAASGELLYVGESKNLRGRLTSHAKSSWDDRKTAFYFCAMPNLTVKCQRLEIENDLIGAFFETMGTSPVFQS